MPGHEYVLNTRRHILAMAVAVKTSSSSEDADCMSAVTAAVISLLAPRLVQLLSTFLDPDGVRVGAGDDLQLSGVLLALCATSVLA